MLNLSIKPRKVSIIGTGHVGSHCGFSLVTQGVCDELLMIDIDESKAKSQALDLSDAVSYLKHATKIKSGNLDDCKDSDIIVISAGPLPEKNQTRLDTLESTINVVKTIVKPIVESGFDGIFIVISNPVDIITDYIWKVSGFSKNKVLGTGTALDSSRLRRLLSEETNLPQQSIQAYSMGEHGDSQIVPWSHVSIGGKPLFDIMKENSSTYGKLNLDELTEKTARAGWDVLYGKGSTEFGIGTALTEIVKAIFHNERKILPVSTLLDGQYGQKDVFAGVPAIIGINGVESIVEINLTDDEQKKFNKSCTILKEYIQIAKDI
ncbi:L-lactate dehydrogenase [Clostridioides sp. ZZV14-6044]|uniref:L-lactate dehydrogenase n=1 Tax=Clostridioides sp. ZZV14-6044 TaxID=2811488 RepID=UPI0039B96878